MQTQRYIINALSTAQWNTQIEIKYSEHMHIIYTVKYVYVYQVHSEI